MSPRGPRQRPDEELELELTDFPSEAKEVTPTGSSPRPSAGAEIVTRSGGGDALTADDNFLSEAPLSQGFASEPDRVPVSVSAPRPAPPPSATPRVFTFSVYAIVAIGGAALGYFAGGVTRTVPPKAPNAALVTSASPARVPLATARPPVHGGSTRPIDAAPEKRAEAGQGSHVTTPPKTADVPSVNRGARPATPLPVTPTREAPRAAVAGGAASAADHVPPPRVAVPPVSAPAAIAETARTAPPTKPEPPLPGPSRPVSVPVEAPRVEAPRADAPRADASTPELAPAEVKRRREIGLIETVLDRYVGAFNTLDAEAARAVWPGVDARALDRVFIELEEQELTFDECRVELDEARATAVCSGVARYVPRVGSRSSRSAARQWTFRLQKVEDRWTIDGVNIR